MRGEGKSVIPIGRRRASLTEEKEEIVELAFDFWLDRFGKRYGSPKDDLLRAWQEVHARTAGRRGHGAGLFLVTKPHS